MERTPYMTSPWATQIRRNIWALLSATTCPGMTISTRPRRKPTTPQLSFVVTCRHARKPSRRNATTTLVRPQVEYSATVWDPHTSATINKLEAVQRRAARFVSSDYSPTSSVTSMLDRLGWESLEQRRQKAKVVMMYRIVHSLIAIPSAPLLQPLVAATRGHSYRYRTPYTRTTTYRESFYPSGIRLWNQLQESVTCAKSLDSFKSGISSIVF